PQHRVQRHGPPGAIDVGRRGDLQRRGHPQSVDRHGAQRDQYSDGAGNYVKRESYDGSGNRVADQELPSFRYQSGFFGLLLIIGSVVVIAAVAIALFIVVRRRRRGSMLPPPGTGPPPTPPPPD